MTIDKSIFNKFKELDKLNKSVVKPPAAAGACFVQSYSSPIKSPTKERKPTASSLFHVQTNFSNSKLSYVPPPKKTKSPRSVFDAFDDFDEEESPFPRKRDAVENDSVGKGSSDYRSAASQEWSKKHVTFQQLPMIEPPQLHMEEKNGMSSSSFSDRASSPVSVVVEEQEEEEVTAPSKKEYIRWEYGREKTFRPVKSKPITNRAATILQRHVRGYLARWHYKVASLEHRFAIANDRESDMDKLREEMEERKAAIKEQLEAEANRKISKEHELQLDQQKAIDYLRRENKRLREKGNELAAAIAEQKEQASRLKLANDNVCSTFAELNEHVKHLHYTNERLQAIIPKYQEKIEFATDALADRQMFCQTEHEIKIMYTVLIANVIEMMERDCTDLDLVDDLISMCDIAEKADNKLPLPSFSSSRQTDDHSEAEEQEDDSDSDSESN